MVSPHPPLVIVKADRWFGLDCQLSCIPRLASLSFMKCESSHVLGVMINLDNCTQLTLAVKAINGRIKYFSKLCLSAPASSMSRSQTRGRDQRGVTSAASLDASCSSLFSSLLFSLEVFFCCCCCFFSHPRNFQYCFPVGVIRPRKLPDDSGGFPEGAVINVFDGEVRW